MLQLSPQFQIRGCVPYTSPLECCPEAAWRNHFTPEAAHHYLSHHRETLEYLHLDLRLAGLFPIRGNPPRWERWAPVPNFREFTALRHLFLDASQWYDVSYELPPPLLHLLPASITSLHFAHGTYCDMEERSAGLVTFAQTIRVEDFKKQWFPDLKEIRCSVYRVNSTVLPDDLVLGALFAGAGVDFGYADLARSEATLNLSCDRPPTPEYDPDRPQPLPDVEDPDL
ncbi:hypothetical protein BJY04DRAFT_218095 [Aspergillus karnatakaensis]|uniref:uncharacterized protein n=1 Tax=Aspergillus karnatakaensis TaxID=1810916 RepID=UPI003CCCABAD